ncbi:CopZ family metallochaperone [Desulfosporosinus fructosivorans]
MNLQDGIVLKIEGMTCGHCKSSVEKALLKVPGVTQAEVDLAQKQEVVIGTADRSSLTKAIDEAGYRVINN